MSPQRIDALTRMGHTPRVAAPGNLEFGSAQLAVRLGGGSEGGIAYACGSDHRRDGQAASF